MFIRAREDAERTPTRFVLLYIRVELHANFTFFKLYILFTYFKLYILFNIFLQFIFTYLFIYVCSCSRVCYKLCLLHQNIVQSYKILLPLNYTFFYMYRFIAFNIYFILYFRLFNRIHYIIITSLALQKILLGCLLQKRSKMMTLQLHSVSHDTTSVCKLRERNTQYFHKVRIFVNCHRRQDGRYSRQNDKSFERIIVLQCIPS